MGILISQWKWQTELTDCIFINCNRDWAAHVDTFQAKAGDLNPISSVSADHICTVHKIKGCFSIFFSNSAQTQTGFILFQVTHCSSDCTDQIMIRVMPHSFIVICTTWFALCLNQIRDLCANTQSAKLFYR